MRARARDADGDHGRHRPRRVRRRAREARRGAGAARAGRHARDRQDRHADRRTPASRGGRSSTSRRDSARTTSCALAAAVEQGSEHPLAVGDRRAAKARGLTLAGRRDASSRSTGQGVHGRVGAADVVLGNARDDARARHRRQRAVRRCVASMRRAGAHRRLRRDRRASRRRHRGRRSDQAGRRARRSTRCAAQGLRIIMLTGDARDTAAAVGAATRLRAGRHPCRGAAGAEARRRPRPAVAAARSSRWRATASTTRRRSRKRRWASRWAPAPTSRCRAPGSRW